MENEIIKRIISSIILLPICFFCILKGSYYFYVFLLLVFIVSSYEWHLLSKKKPYYVLGYIFLIISLISVFQLRINYENGLSYFLIISLVCIFTDIGGFVFGKIFKGPKLIKYSPNKTYSGLIGSYLLSILSIPLIIFFDLYLKDKLILFLFIFVISSTSQFGDIVISYFKRLSNLKDTGKIIPGHGGILDRFDGMLFAFPVSYFLLLTNIF